jgi:hypothetical protein
VNSDDWPLNFISEAIKHIYATPNYTWPEGFQALRRIRIGVRIERRHNQDMYQFEPHNLAPILVLPNIEHLWVNGLCELIHWPEDAFTAPVGSSPLKSLHLQWVDTSGSCITRLLQSMTSLKSAEFEGCMIDPMNEVIEFMSDKQQNSLEELVVEGSLRRDEKSRYGIRDGVLTKFKKLRVLTVDVRGFLCAGADKINDVEELCRSFQSWLPRALESLTWYTSYKIKDEGPILDEALAKLLESGYLPSLKHMAVDALQSRFPAEVWIRAQPRSRNLIQLPKTLDAGAKHGVQIGVMSPSDEKAHENHCRRWGHLD